MPDIILLIASLSLLLLAANYFVDGISTIAESLGVSPASVSTALYKACQKLKSLFFETTQEITNG